MNHVFFLHSSHLLPSSFHCLPLTAETAGELDILRLDGDTLGVDGLCSERRVSKQCSLSSGKGTLPKNEKKEDLQLSWYLQIERRDRPQQTLVEHQWHSTGIGDQS
jgi:hypothetical protein